ncbi:uncharacterized protein LOC135815421 [Sycon ciliatum]|uniref:uncharacterized protein LOC135815421 n=1 Tax=Sycon ciliatum TaxID=27933 RepID=UPI0020A86328|eukprot:scpid62721/ scgid13359/ 
MHGAGTGACPLPFEFLIVPASPAQFITLTVWLQDVSVFRSCSLALSRRVVSLPTLVYAMSAPSKDAPVATGETSVQELRRSVLQLKLSLTNLLKVATGALTYQHSLENNTRNVAAPTESLDACLEEFFFQCDQVSHMLATAYDGYCSTIVNSHSLSGIANLPDENSGQGYSDLLVSLDQRLCMSEQMLSLLNGLMADLSKPAAQ